MTEYNEEEVQPQENEQEETPDFQEESEEEGEDITGEDEDTTDYKALYEEANQKYEQARKDKNGLLKKVSKVRSQPQGSISPERLDKLELRQIDPNLSADQIQDILTIKQAKGLDEVVDAYSHPMVQAFLRETRATNEKKAKVNQATPKAQGGSTVSEGGKHTSVNQSKDWLKKLPSDATEDVAKALKERFFRQ